MSYDDQALRFATSLGIGLLIGLERERHSEGKAGLRTFALITISGSLLAMLSEKTSSEWLLVAGLLLVGSMLVAAYRHSTEHGADPGTTTIAAAIVSYGLGAAVWYGYSEIAVSLTIAVTIVLYFRTELHGLSNALTRRDLVSLLQFAALAFVLLPILPDRTYGPYAALNPYRIGLLVVLISGVSFTGYAALRMVGERRGALVMGLLGGLVSTTATTLIYSRRAREDAQFIPLATFVILVANLVLFLRLALLAAIVAPRTFVALSPIIGAGFVAAATYALFFFRQSRNAQLTKFELNNPIELPAALTFAALFAVVSIGLSWSRDQFGMSGVYIGAFISGLTDLDAISLTSLRMSDRGEMSSHQAVTAIMIAYIANTILKLTVIKLSGPKALLAPTSAGFAAAITGIAVAWLLV